MILLHNPPLIFLKPHKVAATSFEIAPQIAKLVKHHNRLEIERFGYTL